MKRAVFLDRDGVLNHSVIMGGKPHAPRCLGDFRIVDRAAEDLQRLKHAGFVLVVVTNQPDIGNGLVAREEVEAMNARLRDALPVDAVELCPHSQDAGCHCRKPRPGMLRHSAERLGIDLARSYMVGDRFGDVAAGNAAGCRSILLGDGHGEAAIAPPMATVRSLADAVDVILRETPT